MTAENPHGMSGASIKEVLAVLNTGVEAHGQAGELLYEAHGYVKTAASNLRGAVMARRRPFLSGATEEAKDYVRKAFVQIRDAAGCCAEARNPLETTEAAYAEAFSGYNGPHRDRIESEVLGPTKGQGFLIASMGQMIIDTVGDELATMPVEMPGAELQGLEDLLHSSAATMEETMVQFMAGRMTVQTYMNAL